MPKGMAPTDVHEKSMVGDHERELDSRNTVCLLVGTSQAQLLHSVGLQDFSGPGQVAQDHELPNRQETKRHNNS